MEEEKSKLRDALFEKYFESEEDRVDILQVLEQITPMIDVWADLGDLLKKTIKDYEWFDGCDAVRFISYQGEDYLVIKIRMFKYFIVDIKKKKVLTKEDIAVLFTEDFFVTNFGERKLKSKSHYLAMYHFFNCKQNLEELVAFCKVNQKTLEAPNTIYCHFEIEEAWTYLNINMSTKEIQLGFQTPDQTLYDFLHFGIDLEPWGMQDAEDRMGLEKMREICERVKEIKILKTCIPSIFDEKRIQDYSRVRKQSF